MPDTTTEVRYCKTCGYSLRALQSNRCPECGHGFDPLDLRTTARSSRVVIRRRAVRKASVIALSVALGYVCAYFVLVRPKVQGLRFGPPSPYARPKLASYAVEHVWIERLFTPINALDRRIRVEAWSDLGVSSECVEAAKLCDRAYLFLINGLPKESRQDRQVMRLKAAWNDVDLAIGLADTCVPESPARKDALALVHRLQATLELALRDAEAHYRR